MRTRSLSGPHRAPSDGLPRDEPFATIVHIRRFLLCWLVWWWWTLAGHGITALPISPTGLDRMLLVVLIAAVAPSPRRGFVYGLAIAAAIDLAELVLAIQHGMSSTMASFVVTWGTASGLGALASPHINISGMQRRPDTSERAPARGRRLLVAVSVLNVVDALLTWLVLQRGTGQELNPVIDAIGLPAKVVLVAVGSWLIYRWRPAALTIPTAALSLVAIYHVAGWLVAGG